MQLIFLLAVLVSSCSHHRHTHGPNASNQHMHKKSHAELIKAFDDPARDEWQKPLEVLKLMGLLKNKKVIEIGAGSGYFGKFFVKEEANFIAADVDQTFLDHIKKTIPEAATSLIPFDDPKMGSDSFDVAFTSNTYHHIDNRVPYLKKVFSGLKTGGKFVVVDFKKMAEVDGPPLKMRIAPTDVVAEMLDAGFQEVQVFNGVLPRQYVIIGIRR